MASREAIGVSPCGLYDPRMADGGIRAQNREAVDAAITEWTSISQPPLLLRAGVLQVFARTGDRMTLNSDGRWCNAAFGLGGLAGLRLARLAARF
jgi:hypothetical protein